MDMQIKQTDFIDGRYTTEISDNRTVTFVVVDEVFLASSSTGAKVDEQRVNVHVDKYDDSGNKIDGSYGTSIIGIGNQVIGILSDETSLLGKLLTYDNIESCTIRIYD